MSVETNIISKLLTYTPLTTLTKKIYFPIAPSSISGSYVVFFRVSGVSDFDVMHNDDLYQFDIWVDKDDYLDAIEIKDALKLFSRNVNVPGAVMIYENDSQDFQSDPDKYRIIMNFQILNNQ